MYASNYPHLFWFGVFLTPAAFFHGLGDWVFQVFISVVLSVNALLVFGIVRGVTGRKGTGLVAGVLFSWLPSQLFCGLTVTHELAFTLFLLLGIYVWCRRQTFASWILVCVLLSVARLVNSTGIIAIIALVCCLVFARNSEFERCLKNGVLSRLVGIVILIVVVASVSLTADFLQKRMTAGDIQLHSSSIEWQLYVGGNVRTEGRWNSDDVDAFSSVEEQSNNKGALRELVYKRWSTVAQHPVLLLSHLLNKFCNVWSGTHYPIELVNTYVNDPLTHRLLLAIILLNNVCWLLIIGWTAIVLWNRRMVPDAVVVLYCKTTVIGTATMLLLTETMNKYSLTMFGPISVIVGCCFAASARSIKGGLSDVS